MNPASRESQNARNPTSTPGFLAKSITCSGQITTINQSLSEFFTGDYIQWQNRELLQAAHKSPDFRKAWRKFDDLTDQIDPHFYDVTEVIEA
jgi:hypothetical protein